MAKMFRLAVAWGLVLALATLVGLSSGTRHSVAQAPGEAASAGSSNDALVVLSTLDLDSFQKSMATVRNSGGEVLQAYPPNAFVATLKPGVELALRRQSAVAAVEKGVADPASLAARGGQAALGARLWNTAFRGVPDLTIPPPSGSPPEQQGPDFRIPPADFRTGAGL